MKQRHAPAIERAAWAPYARVRAAPTRRAEWTEIVRGVEELEALARKHPGHDVVVHKLLNLLTEGVELLLHHPSVVAASKRASLRLAFAAACIARVPTRFPADSPFGSTCATAWTLGHRTFATHAPSRRPPWRTHLKAFEKAVETFRVAPRTHAEGRLKSTAPVRALMRAGRSAPWIDEATAFDADELRRLAAPGSSPPKRRARR